MKERPRARRITLLGWVVIGLLLLAVVMVLVPGSFWFENRFNLERRQPALTKEVVGVSAVGRHNIYDRNFEPLAVSLQLVSIYARPLTLGASESTISGLASVLGRQEDDLRRELRKTRSFVWLANKVPAATAEQVAKLGLAGIHFVDEGQRYYPHGGSAAHVIGFQQDDQGLAGLELQYDDLLRGEEMQVDSAAPRRNQGSGHLILNLDLRIQQLVEKKLDGLSRQVSAARAMGLVMDPRTGAVLAMVNRPTYDPNRFWSNDTATRRNALLNTQVYAGELFRLVRLAATLEAGQWEEAEMGDAPVFGDPAVTVMPPAKFKEARPAALHDEGESGWLNVRPNIYTSSELAQLPDPVVDAALVNRLAVRLGFGEEAGLDLPMDGEKPAAGGDLAGFDSAIAPVRLLTGFSRLVNGGRPISPRLLQQVWGGEQPGVGAKPASPAGEVVPRRISTALLDTIGAGTRKGPAAAIFFESVSGPRFTGPDKPGGGGTPEELLVSVDKGAGGDGDGAGKGFQWLMLGMAPYFEPEIVILLILDDSGFDPEKASPVRAAADEMVERILRWHREQPAAPDAARLRKLEAEALLAWQRAEASREAGAAAKVERGAAGRMPNVVGMSLRKALQKMEPCGLRISVVGAGRVVSQHPPAGAEVGKDGCTLELRIDQ